MTALKKLKAEAYEFADAYEEAEEENEAHAADADSDDDNGEQMLRKSASAHDASTSTDAHEDPASKHSESADKHGAPDGLGMLVDDIDIDDVAAMMDVDNDGRITIVRVYTRTHAHTHT